MLAIILEGVLFVAVLASGAALLYVLILYRTPLGLRIRQHENRKRLDRAAAQACPIHGPRSPEQMVRLPSGETMCPDCYKETVHG